MATGARSWSTTAATNATADSAVNWAEGQAPSSVNDSARAMMASFAKYREDNNGTLTTAGTSTAYTIATSNQGLALSNGVTVTAKMSVTNGATPTLNVDSLGAKSIQYLSGTGVGTGVLKQNGVYQFVYLSSPDAWVLLGAVNQEFGSGTAIVFYQASAPTGWTIASVDDYALKIASSGAGSTGGSTAFSSIFASRTITASNLPDHTITITDPGHTHTYNAVGSNSAQTGANFLCSIQSVQTGSSTTGITAAFGTSARGGAQTGVDFAVRYAICSICTKN